MQNTSQIPLKWPKKKGFTLLEVIVAVSIFTILAAVSYASINGVVNGKQIITEKRDKVLNLQRVYGLLKNDVRYAVARGVRDELNASHKALRIEQDGQLMSLTVLFPRVNVDLSLKRIAWELRDNSLWRLQYDVLDRVEGGEINERQLLSDVSELNIYTHHFNSSNNTISGNNPTQINSRSVKRSRGWGSNNDGLPLAIEFELIMRDESRYLWLFDMVGGQ